MSAMQSILLKCSIHLAILSYQETIRYSRMKYTGFKKALCNKTIQLLWETGKYMPVAWGHVVLFIQLKYATISERIMDRFNEQKVFLFTLRLPLLLRLCIVKANGARRPTPIH